MSLNNIITEEINQLGAKAVSLNGKDKKLIQVEKKKAKIDLGFVGHITGIDTEVILKELKKDRVVVILPMGVGKDKKTYNVNADEAAASIAISLEAEKLVLLTDVKGVMRNHNDPNSFLSTITTEEAGGLIKENVVQQGMIPKVKACIEALNKGVKKTHVVDARIPHSLLLEIFTDQGIGTEIVK